nr:SGNH/GDSL hydrolase family protein [Mesoplasma tabanidae]
MGFDGNEAKQAEFMKDSIDRVRTGLFNLLNNGVKNIIFMTPPRMDFPPRYRDIFNKANDQTIQSEEHEKAKAKAEFIINICNEYYSKINNVLKEVEQYYPGSIELYDLFNKTDELVSQFKDSLGEDNKNAIIEEAYSNGQAIEVKLNNEKITFNTDPNVDLLQNVSQVINEFKGDIIFGAKNTLDITISATRDKSRISDRDQAMKNYFFTDFVHPTKEVHRLVSDILLGHAEELSKKWKN